MGRLRNMYIAHGRFICRSNRLDVKRPNPQRKAVSEMACRLYLVDPTGASIVTFKSQPSNSTIKYGPKRAFSERGGGMSTQSRPSSTFPRTKLSVVFAQAKVQKLILRRIFH